MHYLAMARILVIAVSTFSYWAAYTSESAEVIFFPIPDKVVTFNPWCEGIGGFAAISRPMTRFLDSRTGAPQASADDAIKLCYQHRNEEHTVALGSEVLAAYGLQHVNGKFENVGDLSTGGCWKP
jgi:hypothetical protein